MGAIKTACPIMPLVRPRNCLSKTIQISSPKSPRLLSSLDLNQLDYDVSGAVSERYLIHKPNPRNKLKLQAVMEGIWADLPQATIDKAILFFQEEAQG